ncbi:MAG: biotin--[acetyl-CoA-carboxylase] ligase [Bacteroidales bacterium]
MKTSAKIYGFSRVKSTNSLAKDWLEKEKKDLPFSLYTFNQTQGRGNVNTSWHSKPKCNICLSFVCEPSFLSPSEQFLLNISLSLGVVDFLLPYLDKGLYLKWPNDVYVGEKKIAGILFENILLGNVYSKAIMGVGININEMDFPLNLPNPISLRECIGYSLSLPEAVVELHAAILNRYTKLAEEIEKNELDLVFNEIKQEYISRLLYYGEKKTYLYKDKKIQAVITDVNRYGHLQLIEAESKQSLSCDLKELKYLFV